MAHLHAVPDPDDDEPFVDPSVDEFVDPAAAVEADEDPGATEAAEAPGAPVEEEVRRYPSTIGGAFYLSILVAAGIALVIAARSDWRLGIQVLGGAILVAALLRLILATRDAGMLAVRNRFVDVFLLTGAGVALIVLASNIPDMPS